MTEVEDYNELYFRVKDRLDHISGTLRWKPTSCPAFNGKFAGKFAGGLDSSTGRWQIRLDGRLWYRYQLVFLLCYGYIPETIDHINGDCLDDRFQNLRDASKSPRFRPCLEVLTALPNCHST